MAMEYVEGETLFQRKKYRQTWAEDLRATVKIFHDQGLVHGDLRDSNILIPKADDTKPIIIDFDWGGEAGKVSFLTPSLQEDLLVTGKRTLAITTNDDKSAVERALMKHEANMYK